jgi:hypothetical protein
MRRSTWLLALKLMCLRQDCLGTPQSSYELSLTSETCIQIVFRYETSKNSAGWCKLSGAPDELAHSRPHYRDVLTAISPGTGSNTTTFCSDSPLGAVVTNRYVLLTCVTLPDAQSTTIFLTLESMKGLSASKSGVVLAWADDRYPSIGRVSATRGDLGLRCVEVAWRPDDATALIDRFCISSADRRLPQHPAGQPRSARAGIAIRIFEGDDPAESQPESDDVPEYTDNGYKRSLSQRIGRMGMLMRRLGEF